MIQIMEKGLGSKIRFEGRTDVVLQWFVPIILLLAAGTGLVCSVSGVSAGDAIIRAVTVMVISCPCTLGIAIPLARVAGISLAGKKGILVRDFVSFEQAHRANTFIFDKTGTLTEGQWKMLRAVPFDPFNEQQVIAMAASLEEDSDHYIAMEIKRQTMERRITPVKLKNVRRFENGISGIMGNDEVKIGSRDFLTQELNSPGPISLENPSEDESQYSLVYMTFGGRPCAVFVFGDKIKGGAFTAVQGLLAMGHRVALISGDGDKTTKAIGQKIGVKEAYGGKLPQAKASFIVELKKEGNSVAMVGDGINDAPALVNADVAISVHSGSSLSKEASDITLMRGDPSQVLDFLGLAKRVNKKIHQNLTCSFFYNVISIPIAMSGLLTPLIAVCAMLMSSLSVIGNTLMLIKKAD
jgi:heavy metal translocating P-type ATPase